MDSNIFICNDFIVNKITTSHDICCLQNTFQYPIIMILYMDALWMRENISIGMDSSCITILQIRLKTIIQVSNFISA